MRLVLVILLLWPVAAMAEPVTLFLSSAAFTVGGVAVSWGTIIFAVGSMIYGQSQQRKLKKDAANQARHERDSFNSSLRDRTVSGIATEFPARFVYGPARVGGNVVAMFTSGARDEYKHIIAELAMQESEGIEEIYLDGQAIGPLDGGGNVTGGPFLRRFTTPHAEASVEYTYELSRVPAAGSLSVVGFATFQSSSDADYTYQVAVPCTFTLAGTTLTITGNTAPFGTAAWQQTQLGPPVGPFVAHFLTNDTESMVRVTKHLGTPSDPVDSNTYSETGGLWPLTAVLRGHTYLAIRQNLNQAEFQGGLGQIEALVLGKKLYDPRTGLTAYSDNNALVAYDYLTSELGGSVQASAIPLAQLIAAANDCDDIVTAGSWSGARYTFSGPVTSMQPREEVLEKIAQSMAGGIVATTWEIYAGKFAAPVMALTQADIVGEIAISPGLPLGDVYNTVKGQFVSAENAYVATDYKPYQNAAYLALDGEELTTDIDLPYTNTQQRCTNLARIFTEDNRNSFSINGKFSLKTWRLKVGERVTVTSAFFGQSAKVFRVTDKAFRPDGMVHLGMKEDVASIYDLADETQADATPNTGLANQFFVSPLASLSCESGTSALLVQADGTVVSRILVSWPLATTQGVLQNGSIEIEHQQSGTFTWQKTPASGEATSAYLSDVNDGLFYTVRGRCVNPYVSAKSDWTYAALHQVIGKTELPPDVAFFTIDGAVLRWVQVIALDLLGYLIRFHYGNNAYWGSGTPLHAGVITSSPYTLAARPSGVVTLMIKAVDTSGNESATAAVIVVNLGDQLVSNVLISYPEAPAFTGTITSGAVAAGVLQATATDLFYGDDDQPFYGPDGDPFYALGTFTQMQYEWAVTVADAGTLILQHTISASDYTIEYQRDSQAAFYGPDADQFYGPDAEPFYGAPGAWDTWPGSLVIADVEEVRFRITTAGGPVRGEISQATVVLDVPDVDEKLNDIVIAIGGTRLPITKSYRFIQNVLLQLQTDGNGGTSVTVEDKDAEQGPLVIVRNAGVSVVGLIDADIQGY